MSTSGGTVDVQTGIENYDFLKFVNANFLDSVGHYINMWNPYHQMFAMAASGIVTWGGMAWVAVMMLKAPADNLKTAVGAMGVVFLTLMLLSAGTYNIPGAGASLQLSNGAGWTVEIIGNIYQLFKKSLDAMKDEEAIQMAFDNAYHVTDQNTLKRFIDSPMAPMYQDYIEKCQPAFAAAAGSKAEAVSSGRYVGLYGSGGIGQDEVTIEKSNGFIDKLTGADPNADKVVQASPLKVDGGNAVEEGVAKGLAILKSIPTEVNPFDGQTVPTSGYQIPTKAYWDAQMFGKTSSEPVFYDVTATPDNYLNTAYVDGEASAETDKTRAYPKNCADLYKMVDMGQRAWTASVNDNLRVGQATAAARDGRDASMMLYRDTAQRLAQQGKLDNTTLSALAGYNGAKLYDHGAGGNLTGLAFDTAFSQLQDIGRWFQEKMLKYKIPMMITCCAMMAGFLVVWFPIIMIMAVFISPKIMMTFVKLMTFAFLVPLINDACLTMAATLLAVNGELMEGYNAGNFTQNDQAVLSAATAQYVVFIALTVVEVIFAKMLIWDDVKGLGGFNPGGAATSLAAAGGKIVGAAVKLGSTLAAPAHSVGSSAAGTSPQITKASTAKVQQMNQIRNNLSAGGSGGGSSGSAGGGGQSTAKSAAGAATGGAKAAATAFLSTAGNALPGSGIQKPTLTPPKKP